MTLRPSITAGSCAHLALREPLENVFHPLTPMPIFHASAYLAACKKLPPERRAQLTDDHFEEWAKLAEALGWLCDEQLCDAIYGDWLLQLESVAGQTALLQVRSYLLGQGALAANYFAELAQNADDAADESDAEIRVTLDGDWLLFANNGRKVTPRNLLGLSRFFVHHAREVVELTQETIGKFGIGFKSCYRIASEVIVRSWDQQSGELRFRLPISNRDLPESWSEPDRLQRIAGQLRAQGERIGGAILSNHDKLGYGTPEYLEDLPLHLPVAAKTQPPSERGTLFCFHLHAAGRREVQARIGVLEKKLSELCPLFLRNVRTVQLGGQTLEMKVSRKRKDDSLPGQVSAVRVELSTSAVGEDETTRENFWKLTGATPDDRWQIALRADSQDRIHRVPPGAGLTLGEGGAYAFFPLNAVAHPFRFHLHIDLPTNLARDNWNGNAAVEESTGEVGGELNEQLTRSVDGLTSWLARQHEQWHPDWRLEELYRHPVDDGHSVAGTMHAAFRRALGEKELLRTVWGDFCTGAEALAIELPLNSNVKRHWLAMAVALPHLRAEFPFVPQSCGIDLGLNSATFAEQRKFFLRAAEQPGTSAGWWLNFTGALFGSEATDATSIERVAKLVPVAMVDGTETTLAALLSRAGGEELAAAWHALFSSIRNWMQDDPARRNLAIFGERLGLRIERLATPVFSAEWEELATKMATEAAWQAHGDDWWAQQRGPCPPGIRDAAVAALRICDGTRRWKLITQTWLFGSANVGCFHGLIEPWEVGAERNLQRQRTTLEKLDHWSLKPIYREALSERIEEELPERLSEKLESSERPLSLLTEALHVQSRSALEQPWRRAVEEAEVSALRGLTRKRKDELRGKTFLANDIPFPLRVVIELLPGYSELPRWLGDGGWELIVARGLDDEAGFSVLASDDLTAVRKAELGRALLECFHNWSDHELTPANVEALAQLCAAATGQWSLGVSQRSKRRLEEFYHAASGVADDALSEMLVHAGTVTWSLDALPAVLAAVESIAKACRQPRELRLAIEGQSRPLTEDRMHPELRTHEAVQRLLVAQPPLSLRHQQALHLIWKARGDVVCEIRGALFAVHDGQLIVSKAVGGPDERQYERVLGFYELCAHGDVEFRTARELEGATSNDLYHRFRERILGVLRKELVADVGYTARHVVRELLQNAESAYASMPTAPSSCSFTLTVQASERGTELIVEARHHGRGFNQVDREKQARPDVQRIVSLRADLQNTAEEVGRFNRGFKSLFSIAERVRVRSAGYDFSIEDLLILDPSDPQPDPARDDGETRFSFQCKPIQAAQMLRSTGRSKLRVFEAADFVFLRHITVVEIEDRGERRTWSISRRDGDEGWLEVVIREETAQTAAERFWVFHGASTRADRDLDRRFAVAVAIDADGHPRPVEGDGNRLFLTFPTETAGPFGFLVNGDFEIDRGRLEVRRDSIAALLLKDAIETVVERLRVAARVGLSRDAWRGWARTLAPEDTRRALRTLFPQGDSVDVGSVLDTGAGFLRQRVPLGGGWCRLDELRFPSRLLRRLAESPEGNAWRIETGDWIDAGLSAEAESLLTEKKSPYGLYDFVGERCRSDSSLRSSIRSRLEDPEFAITFTAGLIEASREIDAALVRLISQEAPPPFGQRELFMTTVVPPSLPLAVEDLMVWWEAHEQPDAYILDGGLWPLFFSDLPGLGSEARRARLVAELSKPETPEGQRLWYQVLGLACLMSAGWPVARVLRFWNEKLAPASFWELAEHGFGAANSIFEQVIHEEARGANAAGEDATFWRRIFYDVRKVRHLIYKNQFGEAVMELARDSRDAEHLLQFLKTGKLPGERAWRGVLGQSAGTPLFFVVRELRRLGVITHSEVDASAFFVCKPVRQVAARLGWIRWEEVALCDFESLQALSAKIHKAAKASAAADACAEWFDIPLLHYALNHR